jgi:hypothetical protein
LHVSRAQGAGVAEAVAMFDGAGQHIGDGLDAAVRMPGKPLEVLLRLVVAEIVKQQERIGERRIVESRMRASRCTPAPSRCGTAVDFLSDGSDGHGCLLKIVAG